MMTFFSLERLIKQVELENILTSIVICGLEVSWCV
jgi:hypothetical protein